MSRPERPLDPAGGTVHEFAAALRRLRVAAGSPVYRQMARHAHYSSTTLSDAAGGRKLPSLAVALAYAEACGGRREEWETRWQAATAQLSRADRRPSEAVGAGRSPDPTGTPQVVVRRRRADLALICFAAGVVLATVITAATRRPRTRQRGYGGILPSVPAD